MKNKNILLVILLAVFLQPALSKAIPPTYTVVVSAHTNACNGSSNGTATALASGGNTPYTYSWSPGGQTNATAIGLSAGTYTITVNENSGGLSATASVIIEQSSAIVPTATVTTPILCFGGTGNATVGATGGVSPYTYSWSAGGGTNATISSFTVSGTTTYTAYGTYPTFTVPAGVTQLSITLSGAAGGLGSNGPNQNGGDGVGFTGVVSVTPGHVLGVIVGAAGAASSNAGAGGGGASYVWDESNATFPLAIAAGGGGGGLTSAGAAGGTNLTTNAATVASANNAAGGTGGNGGAVGSGPADDGAGGAGWLSNGGNGNGASGGNDMASGFTDGIGAYNGGWGGGGGGSANGGGGGGGGYNGGGGGLYADNSGTYIYGGGGGGGSYLNGTLSGTARANNTGNGSVTIHYSASSGSGVPIGTYDVTVTDANGCSASASVTLTQPTLLTTSASVITNACYGVNNGDASMTPSGGVLPYTYSWSNGATTSSTGAVLSGGTYTVTVQDNNGCSSTASIVITQPAQPLSTTATPISGACNSTSNGNAMANPTGGSVPYTYSWSNGATNSATGSILSAGTYTVTVYDRCGSSATASVTINQSSAITATTSVINPITCYGASNGSADVGATGGVPPYTYSWSSNGGTTSTINSYNTSGAATFTLVGAEQFFTVPAGVIQVSINVNGAKGGQGGGGTGNNQAGGKGAGFTAIASVTPGHSLGVVLGGIGGNGNTGSDGGGGGGGATYVWDNSGNILIASAGGGGGGNFGNGGANVSGGAGGTNLTTNAAPNGGAGGSNAAGGTGGNGGTVLNSAGDGAGGAGWYSNGENITASGNVEGGSNYSSGFGGGSGYAANGNGGYGGGGGGGQGAGGGGGGYNGGGGGTTGGGGGGGSYFNAVYGTLPATVTATNAGNGFASIGYSVTSSSGVAAGTYVVTVTDANGCDATASVTLTQPAILSVSASVIAYTCNGSSTGNVKATPIGGASPYTYSWSSGQTTSATGATLSQGTYTVTVKDACGSSAVASAVISQPPALTASTSVINNVSCRSGNNGNASASPSGGAAPYTYSWSNGSTSNPTGAVLNAGTYTVTVMDNCGSTVTSSVVIAEPNALSATASATRISCPGSNTGSASVSSSGGTSPYTYSWSPAGGANSTGTGLSAGTFTVTVHDNCGVSATASVSISQSAALSATASVTADVSCYGESSGSASASPSNGSSPYTYSWAPGGGSNSIASGLSSGSYTVTVSDQCSSVTAAVNITEPSAISVRRDSVADNGTNNGVAGVTVSGGKSPYTYSWTTGGQTTSSITRQSAGVYCCVISDNNGCTNTTCITIKSPTGVDNISNSSVVNVYPDPNTGYFTITGIMPGQIVELYDYTGRKVAEQYAQAGTTIHFDITTKANGIYLVRIVNKDGTLVTQKKIVKIE